MKKTLCILTLLLLGITACASFAQKGRMEKFSELSDAYRRSLLDADFRNAAQFSDPAAGQGPVGDEQYKNIKIVEYKITHTDVSDDYRKIEQDVELHYFLINRNILKILRQHQVWRYREQEKLWRLQTRLPVFGP